MNRFVNWQIVLINFPDEISSNFIIKVYEKKSLNSYRSLITLHKWKFRVSRLTSQELLNIDSSTLLMHLCTTKILSREYINDTLISFQIFGDISTFFTIKNSFYDIIETKIVLRNFPLLNYKNCFFEFIADNSKNFE